jgi:hypothetical protein
MSMESYGVEQPYEWYVRDMIRYHPMDDTFSCVHRDFEGHCPECHVIVFRIEESVLEVKCRNEPQKG